MWWLHPCVLIMNPGAEVHGRVEKAAVLRYYCIVTVLVDAWPCTPGHTSASQSKRTSQPAAPAETFLAMALWRNTAVAVLLVSPWSYRSAKNTSAGCNNHHHPSIIHSSNLQHTSTPPGYPRGTNLTRRCACPPLPQPFQQGRKSCAAP